MLTPVECLEEQLYEIQVELDFTNDTGIKSKYKELKEAYKVAIGILKSAEE